MVNFVCMLTSEETCAQLKVKKDCATMVNSWIEYYAN